MQYIVIVAGFFYSPPARRDFDTFMKKLLSNFFLYSLLLEVLSKSRVKCILVCILFAFAIVLFINHSSLVSLAETVSPDRRWWAHGALFVVEMIVVFLFLYVIVSIFRKPVDGLLGCKESVKNTFTQAPKSVSRMNARIGDALKKTGTKLKELLRFKQSKQTAQPKAPQAAAVKKAGKAIQSKVEELSRKGGSICKRAAQFVASKIKH